MPAPVADGSPPRAWCAAAAQEGGPAVPLPSPLLRRVVSGRQRTLAITMSPCPGPPPAGLSHHHPDITPYATWKHPVCEPKLVPAATTPDRNAKGFLPAAWLHLSSLGGHSLSPAACGALPRAMLV